MIADYFLLTFLFENKKNSILTLKSTLTKYKLELFSSPDYIFPFNQCKLKKIFNKSFIPSIFIETINNRKIIPITIYFNDINSIENNKEVLNFLKKEYENKKKILHLIAEEFKIKYGLSFLLKPENVYSIFNIAHNILLNNENILNSKIDKYLLGKKSERPILNLTKDLLTFEFDTFQKYFLNTEKLFEFFTNLKTKTPDSIKIYYNFFSDKIDNILNLLKKFPFDGMVVEKEIYPSISNENLPVKIKFVPASYFISEKYSPTISAGTTIQDK